MKIIKSKVFNRHFAVLSFDVKELFFKQAEYLLSDLRHPSLHAKKFDKEKNIWQARVNREFRFYFQIKGDIYLLIDIIKHPK